MAVRYRSKKTGKVLTYSNPMPRLERDKRFERLPDGWKPADDAKPKTESKG